MLQTTLTPTMLAHVRAGRYAQRERPAATIPARLHANGASKSTQSLRMVAASPAIFTLLALRSPRL
jgi:hypothetical protein